MRISVACSDRAAMTNIAKFVHREYSILVNQSRIQQSFAPTKYPCYFFSFSFFFFATILQWHTRLINKRRVVVLRKLFYELLGYSFFQPYLFFDILFPRLREGKYLKNNVYVSKKWKFSFYRINIEQTFNG